MSNITQQLAENRKLIKYCCKEVPSLWREDAEQEASLAFIKAVETYDPAKAAKFSSWACLWMRRAVMDFCRTNIPPIEFVPFDGLELSYEPKSHDKEDLVYLMRKIPQFQAKKIISFLRNGLGSRSDRTVKACGVRNLRRVFEKEFNKI